MPPFRTKSSFLAFLDKNTEKYIQLLSANNSAHQEVQSKYFPSKTHYIGEEREERGGRKEEEEEGSKEGETKKGWRRKDEERKRKEEEGRRMEEKGRTEEEKKRREEDDRRRKDEDKRRKEEGRRKEEEGRGRGREEEGGKKVKKEMIVGRLPKLNLQKRNASEPNFMNILKTETELREEERRTILQIMKGRSKISLLRKEKKEGRAEEVSLREEGKRREEEGRRREDEARRMGWEPEITKEGKRRDGNEEKGRMESEAKEGGKQGISGKSFCSFKSFGRSFLFEESRMMKNMNRIIKTEVSTGKSVYHFK